MKIIVFTLIVLFALGYVAYYKKKKGLQEAGFSGKMISRTFTVSLIHPLDESQSIELISINKNGSATIRTLYSNETLTTKPSEYFKGKDFGSFGLRLKSISQESQEIQLRRTAPEHLG